MPSVNRQYPVYHSHPPAHPSTYRNQHFPPASQPLRQTPQPYYTIAKDFRSPASRIHARPEHHNDLPSNSQRPRKVNPPLRSAPIDRGRPENEAAEILQRMGGGGWVGYESKENEVRRASEDSGFGGESKSVETHGGAAGMMGWTEGIRKAVWGSEEQSRGALAHNIANQHQGADAIWNRVLAATTAISSSVGGLAQSNDDDDTSLDADGNTKLTRVIKQYHISTAQSSADLPQWLFSPSEFGHRPSPPPSIPPPSSQRAVNRSYSDVGHRHHHSAPHHDRLDRVPHLPSPVMRTQPNRLVENLSRQPTLAQRDDGWGHQEDVRAVVSKEEERGSSKTTNRLRKMKQEKVVRAATYSGGDKQRRYV